MHDPKLYHKCNGLQRRDAAIILDEYFRLIKFKPEGNDVILDIGCGVGDVTWDILRPKLPPNFGKLIGSDISQDFVKYASATYIHPNVEFATLDISDTDVPDNFRQKFDHIFSFYCLHWVQNQRQAMTNIFNLLKPGGDMLVMFLAKNHVFDIYETMAKIPKWRLYMQDVQKYLSPYQHVSDVEETARNLLRDIGFDINLCQCKKMVYEFENLNVLQKAVFAVNPFLKRMPDNMKDEYFADYVTEVKKLNLMEENNNNNNKSQKISSPYQLIVLSATKPSP